MKYNSIFLDVERSKIELSETSYLAFDSYSTDFHVLKNKGPMILDAGVVVFV